MVVYMKDYIKKFIIRLFILFFIVMIILFGSEFILKKFSYRAEWHKENAIINQMNNDKLSNIEWFEDALWQHKNEIIEPKKDGTKRILIIGDSYIWGDGYSNANHLWWQQFKHLLKEEGYNSVEVFAAGLCGYSTQQELEYILKDEELMQKVNPDLIIIGYVINDPEFRYEKYKLSEKLLVPNDIYYYSNNKFINSFKQTFPNLYSKMSNLLSNKLYNEPNFIDKFGLEHDLWVDTISSGKWLEKYDFEVMKPLSQYIENELKIPYFFYMTSVFGEKPLYNIMNLFEKYNIDYYFAYGLMEEQNIFISDNDDDRKINPVNWHPSVSDCKLFAELLLNIMEENYSDFLGDKNGTYQAKLNINDWMPYSLKPKRDNDNVYVITYPSLDSENSFLTLPVNKKYIKLNLEDPLQIDNIEISGNDIEEIEIFINYIDKELDYDTQKMISLGTKKDDFIWNLDNSLEITSINISAKIKDGKSQRLTITIE